MNTLGMSSIIFHLTQAAPAQSSTVDPKFSFIKPELSMYEYNALHKAHHQTVSLTFLTELP